MIHDSSSTPRDYTVSLPRSTLLFLSRKAGNVWGKRLILGPPKLLNPKFVKGSEYDNTHLYCHQTLPRLWLAWGFVWLVLLKLETVLVETRSTAPSFLDAFWT